MEPLLGSGFFFGSIFVRSLLGLGGEWGSTSVLVPDCGPLGSSTTQSR